MTFRTDFLNGKLASLCGPDGRLVSPRGMGPQAQADELAALCRALDRLAPSSGWEAWWSRFEDALMGGLTSRAWPMVADIVRVGKQMSDASRIPTGPAVQADMTETRKAQLLRWCKGEGPCGDYLITRENLEALANVGAIQRGQIDGMLAFSRKNHGVSAEADRMRKTLPEPLEAGGTNEEILERLEAMGQRLRGNGVRNPAFTRAAE